MTLAEPSANIQDDFQSGNDAYSVHQGDDDSLSFAEDNGRIEKYHRDDGGMQLLGFGDEGRVPYVGNVSIVDSSEVHIGDRHIYQGPVTIRQIVYANGSALLYNADAKLTLQDSEQDASVDSGYRTDGAGGRGGDVRDNSKSCDKTPPIGRDAENQINNHVPEVRKGLLWLQNVPRKRLYGIFGFSLAFVVIVLTLLATFLILKHPSGKAIRLYTDEQEIIKPISYDPDITEKSQRNNTKLRITSRQEWVAQPPSNALKPLGSSVPYVIIDHTKTDNCSSHAQCVFRVRYLQTYHIESKGLHDISFNFLIGGDGAIYEGRGWNIEGAHTFEYTQNSIGIAFIGTFVHTKPTEIQILICKRLIEKGIELGRISKDYKLLVDKKLAENVSTALYKEMKSWPHFGGEA